MIATLPMYDWPEVREATDAWWRGIARHVGSSVHLSRSGHYSEAWRQKTLLFSQTCGYPFTHEFKDKLHLVATPHYAVDGASAADYCSIILARERKPLEAFRGSSAAYNGADSMSGMLALKLVFAPFAKQGRFFAEATVSGGHINSMMMVRDGKADVCAIDAICVALARRYRPDYLDGLVEIARSPLVPGLPYVTIGGDVAALRAALQAAFADPSLQNVRDQLFLSGFSILPVTAYDRILDLENAMTKAGGLELA